MKIKKVLKKNLLEKIMWRVALADEGQANLDNNEPTPVNEPTPTPQVNFEELIAKARKEEKEKLYPEINKLKAQVDEKVKRINELLLAIGEKDELIKQKEQEIAELKKSSKKDESEEVKALKVKIAELENALAQKDNEINQVKLDAYKTQKIAEAGGELIPELVFGNTPEEIDMAIERAKEKYLEIVNRVKSTVQPVQLSTQIPPVNPSVQQNPSNVNTFELTGVSLFDKNAKKQYEEMRKQLLTHL